MKCEAHVLVQGLATAVGGRHVEARAQVLLAYVRRPPEKETRVAVAANDVYM